MATCNSADSILEAAALIKANGGKIDKFTNGASNETVQLGTGDPTPTLRKFLADAQDALPEAAADILVERGVLPAPATDAEIDALFS